MEKEENGFDLICMSFDGEYVRDVRKASFDDCEYASADMGSKWFFYPFHLIVDGNDIVVSSGGSLCSKNEYGEVVSMLSERLSGMRLSEVAALFNAISTEEEMESADAEAFECAIVFDTV